MEQTSIAVLMTCHNRKSKTLATLESLFQQRSIDEIGHKVYLVDDGSTDGTAEAVQQTYPDVKIFAGDGNLFWNGGMRIAFSEAIKDDPDYYLWLNDDTILYPEALSSLLTTSRHLLEQGEENAIVAGSTCDPDTGDFTYGGIVKITPLLPFKFRFIEPTKAAQPCDSMNGNCVLIPRSVVQLVGNLDPAFIHYLSDWEYGLRARQKGCTVWIAPGYQGTCSPNPQATKVAADSMSEGLEKMNQPKGLTFQDATLQPWEEWKVFAQRHGGLFWPIYWLLPYRRLVWFSVLSKLGLTKNKTEGK
ncbi:glycosyltransferase family 2 protein [filamentous cyanobacterium Phorm 46]|nr:glycosyltransferase family 2 protein [filamentous cyanobacterium Phorm 46]PSB53118.1 glycosyltransferase family 2 protein [filamentous cyanobacterium Phorm 6]